MDAIELTPFGPFRALHEPKIQVTSDIDLQSRNKQHLLFLSAGLTACFTSSFYNSLDCLRVRWQVQPLEHGGIVHFARQIIRTEGFINGLCRPGIFANAMGMSSSAALRFGYYETMRDALQEFSSNSKSHGPKTGLNAVSAEKSGLCMAIAGFSCGAVAYFVTTPFHLLKTMIQAEKGLIGPDGRYVNGTRIGKLPYATDFISGSKRVISNHGVAGLWKGCIPLSARGALFTGGQMLGYDGFKSICKRNGFEDGPQLQFASSIVAAFGATILSTPADYVMSRYMSSYSTNGLGVTAIVRQIYAEGVTTFWRGGSVNFYRAAPVLLTYSALYEQIRFQLGLGYLS